MNFVVRSKEERARLRAAVKRALALVDRARDVLAGMNDEMETYDKEQEAHGYILDTSRDWYTSVENRLLEEAKAVDVFLSTAAKTALSAIL